VWVAERNHFRVRFPVVVVALLLLLRYYHVVIYTTYVYRRRRVLCMSNYRTCFQRVGYHILLLAACMRTYTRARSRRSANGTVVRQDQNYYTVVGRLS